MPAPTQEKTILHNSVALDLADHVRAEAEARVRSVRYLIRRALERERREREPEHQRSSR